jgi:hypothetical protein
LRDGLPLNGETKRRLERGEGREAAPLILDADVERAPEPDPDGFPQVPRARVVRRETFHRLAFGYEHQIHAF